MPNTVEPTIPNYPPQGIQAQLDLLYLYNADAANKLLAELNAIMAQAKELEKVNEADIKALQEKVAAEIERAMSAEQGLDTKIEEESSRALSAESSLNSKINGEISRATTAEQALDTKIEAETTRAETAEADLDTKLSTAISDEQSRAEDAESALNDAITAETTRAEKAETDLDTKLTTAINAETTRAEAAEKTLDDKIAAETTRAEKAESDLETSLTAAVDAETARAEAAEATLTTALSTETTRATTAEATLQTNINAEKTAREAADTALSARVKTIEDEIPAAASATNKLADKAFVNSTIQTATANFRGNWADWAAVPSVDTGYPEDYANSRVPTINDYLVVSDASDYTDKELSGTWRFKYTGTWAEDGKNGWLPEYQVNEEPLTMAQLDALNSGITAEVLAALQSGVAESLPAVAHDDKFTGTGTSEDPLKLAEEYLTTTDATATYLPLAGGTMTGRLTLTNPNAPSAGITIRNQQDNTVSLTINDSKTELQLAIGNTVSYYLNSTEFRTYGSKALGSSLYPWSVVYAKQIHNGAKIDVPTTGGTLALTSDIPDVSSFLETVTVDSTLTGTGTAEDPLKVANPVPTDGTEGQILTKTEDGMGWADLTLPANVLYNVSKNNTSIATTGATVANNRYNTAYGIGANAKTYDSTAIGANVEASIGVAIGTDVTSDTGIAIGYGIDAGVGSIVIGRNGSVVRHPAVKHSVVLGYVQPASSLTDTITDEGFYWIPGNYTTVGNSNKYATWKMLDGLTGLVPVERIATGGTAGQVLSKTDTGMEWTDVAAGDSLPEQTGHTGYLQTNGTEATWSDKTPIVNQATKSGATCINCKYDIDQQWSTYIGCQNQPTSTTAGTVQIGYYTGQGGMYSVGIGFQAKSTGYMSIAIGEQCSASGRESIQLGAGDNSEENTFQVFDYQVIDQNGHVPTDRLTNVVKTLDTMPANYTTLNEVVMYTGETNATYTQGTTYRWEQTGSQTPEFQSEGFGDEITITDPELLWNAVQAAIDQPLQVGDALMISYYGGDTYQNISIDVTRGRYGNTLGYVILNSLSEAGLSADGDYGTGEFIITKTAGIYNWVALSEGGSAGGDYLPLSGGTMTASAEIAFENNSAKIYSDGINQINIGYNGHGIGIKTGGYGALIPLNTWGGDLGSTANVWRRGYIAQLNHGADIAIPTTGGTMALTSDIEAAVGDIASVLDAINGEVE